MTSIVRFTLENDDGNLWERLATRVAAWALAQDLALRDAVVLLPFAQLLPPARRAFARQGGWMPRIETTRTLAAGLGPPVAVPIGQISFDSTLDALNATALLRSQPWGAGWARRDARGFEQAVNALVATAHELVRGAAAVPPTVRAAHWAAARERFVPAPGPGGTERLLSRVALEWASLAPAPLTDRLFTLAPAAWIVVQAGGPEPLASALLAQERVPGLVVDTDPAEDAPFARVDAHSPPALAVCDGFEHEAQATAAQVLQHVQRGEVPIALIAEDRVLVRRVRALLERHELRLSDETGWKLSTTRAAALVMSLLQAARPDASTDALFEWLKAGTSDRAALDALEALCRKRQITRVCALRELTLPPPADRLWALASGVLDGLSSVRRQPLAAWSEALAGALHASGALAVLKEDDAGRQLLAELRLGRVATTGAWAASASQAEMGLVEFRNWVDGVMERATFRPVADFDQPADVVVTPLAQAVLRPFAAVVLPGADDRHLGGARRSASLLDDAQAAALGLPTAARRRGSELQAFAHLLEFPRVTLLRRRADGNEPLAESLLVERLGVDLASKGSAFLTWRDPRVEVVTTPTPVHMTAPGAPGLLPARLSASACEALRACPYRFFALYLLGLREDDELEREVEKRDYGTWLHAVLFEFHRARGAPESKANELARLRVLAAQNQAAQGMVDADFLPFAASFASFAPRYIDWLHLRDAQGIVWQSGEDEVELGLDALGGTTLHGIIDRVDQRGFGAAATIELIDYKTGSASGLKEKVKIPLEDTQLAFYAALMRSRTPLPISAHYLALDATKGLEEVDHPEVERSAAALVDGLGDDLRRLREGAGLPAMGEGSTCDFCAARGICRRDHWEAA
jgi:ATP-dependent helicase/nuclease subunit B